MTSNINENVKKNFMESNMRNFWETNFGYENYLEAPLRTYTYFNLYFLRLKSKISFLSKKNFLIKFR